MILIGVVQAASVVHGPASVLQTSRSRVEERSRTMRLDATGRQRRVERLGPEQEQPRTKGIGVMDDVEARHWRRRRLESWRAPAMAQG